MMRSTQIKLRCAALHYLRLGLAVVAVSLVAGGRAPLHAMDRHSTRQQSSGWSEPIDLAAGTKGRNTFPVLVADSAGGVHAFWDEVVDVEGGTEGWVDYAYWDGRVWTPALDAFVGGRNASAWGAQAVVDASGLMHTIWIDGARGLRYAQRQLPSPASAQSWTGHITLVDAAYQSLGPATIALDESRGLHVVYVHAAAAIPGVYYLHSSDLGANWSEPALLSDPGTAWEVAQRRYEVDLAAVGREVHVVWAQRDLGEIAYSRRDPVDNSWTPPQLIGGRGWPTIHAQADGSLLVLSTHPPAIGELLCLRMQNVTRDGGDTWSGTRVILQPGVHGCLGKMNVAVDSLGRRHLITSAYVDLGWDRERIWHSTWTGSDWQRPEVVEWAATSYDALGKQPDFPSAAISAGNLLHVAFHTDEGHIWYTQLMLSAPAAPPVAFPTIRPVDTRQPVEASPTAAAPTRAARRPSPVPPDSALDPTPPHQSRVDPLLVAAALSLLLVMGTEIGRLVTRRRRM